MTVASERKPIDYVLADDLATLVWLANLAAIELHVPLARAPAIERPTAVVFDLDPGAPASIVECCRVALQLQGMFEHLGLQSFAKTSGSKGLQVYVPLNDARRRLRADEAVREGRRRAARERRTGARRLAHDQGAAHRQGADRLEPERREEDDRLRLLAARDRAPDGLDAARLGRGAGDARLRKTLRASRSTQGRCSSAWPSAATCSRPCCRWCRSCRARRVSTRTPARSSRASRRAGHR